MGAAPKARRFPTTRWSLVLAAGGATSSHSRLALDELCRVYWYPLYCFARSQGKDADAAADLTQAFIADLLQRKDLARVEQDRGRFRSWLLGCFKHFLFNDTAHAHAQKRGGGQATVSIDAVDAEGRYERELVDGVTPEKLYLRRWTQQLLERTLVALRTEAADPKRFDALKPYLTDEGEGTYATLGEAMGLNANAAKQAVHQLRVKYRERLRAEVAETLDDPDDVDSELALLIDSLS
jgi:DNA-directed RNA polymerase specialized sigma24 family protein